MKTLLKVTSVLIAATMLSSGCASYAVYKGSEKQVATKKALASGDEAAIRAVQLGDGVGVGIDVSNIEALTERPWLQLGAAVLDAVSLYAANEGIKALNDDGDTIVEDNTPSNASGGDTIIVTGDGNTVNTGDTDTNPNLSL